MSSQKKYGLVFPKSLKLVTGKIGKSASVFQHDSSEEDESKKKIAINQELNAVAEKKKQTKQTKEEIERALMEDPDVYKYDEIYDDMEQKKKDIHVAAKAKDKKPKYIANLLKSAAMRKREQERRVERGVQKEREKEGDQFADKESFVTAAYRQKMLDQAEEEERLRKQDELDAANDVTKQKDLSKFYRNLLDRNVAMGAPVDDQKNTKIQDNSASIKRDKTTGDEIEGRAPLENSENETASKSGMKISADRNKKKESSGQKEHKDIGSSKVKYKSCKNSSSDFSFEEDLNEKSKRASEKYSHKRGDKRSNHIKGQAKRESSSDSSDLGHEKEFDKERKTGKRKAYERESIRRKGSKTNSLSKRHRSNENSSSDESCFSANDLDSPVEKKGREIKILQEEKLRKEDKREKRSHQRYKKEDNKAQNSPDSDSADNLKRRREKKRREKRDLKRNRSDDEGKQKNRSHQERYRRNDGGFNYAKDEPKRQSTSSHLSPEISPKNTQQKVLNEKEKSKRVVIDKERLKVFAKRNDSDMVSEARERFLTRKRARITPITHDDDSD